MRIVKYILCVVLALSCGSVYSQDWQRAAERSTMGTARYVGLGGAMTAVGGDPSAALVNPAGLGVYRRMEVSLTGDLLLTNTMQEKTNNLQARNVMSIPQFSWVSTFPTGQQSGLISNSIMVSYNRVHRYDRVFNAAYTGEPFSLMDVAAIKTNGLPEDVLQADDRWDDPNIGWLSILGYENYLIDPVWDANHSWITPLVQDESITNNLTVKENGYCDKYSFTWGMNYGHRFYLGAGLNLTNLSFRHTTSYVEYPDNGGSLRNEATSQLSGVGVDVSFGLIYRPVQFLRLGASVQAPTFSQYTISNYGTMDAQMMIGSTDKTKCETPVNRSSISGFYSPVRTSVGLAFMCKNYALFSLQYDFAGGMKLMNEHTFRAGVEVQIVNRVLIDAGYSYTTGFKQFEPWSSGMYYDDFAYNNRLSEISVRTDTDFQRTLSSSFIGAGLGYHGTWGTIHLAYQYGKSHLNLYAHEFAAPYDMRATSHRLVLTLNWHTN